MELSLSDFSAIKNIFDIIILRTPFWKRRNRKKVFQGVGISLYEAGRQIIYSIKNQYL